MATQPRPRSLPPIQTFGSIIEIHCAGFVAATDPLALPPVVGDEAVVNARGNLRLGIISRVGRKIVDVDVCTPTSPSLVTKGHIGGRFNETNGWLRSSKPYEPCLETKTAGAFPGARCRLTKGHASNHRCGPVRHDQTYDEVWR
jgi:hypothetical protein